jgi:hypothetical protein
MRYACIVVKTHRRLARKTQLLLTGRQGAPRPDQSFEQMGESALVSERWPTRYPIASSACSASPTQDRSRVHRPLGPAASRVTLQQQVGTNITFTYLTALDNPNSQIILVEWAFNLRWSAVASRGENGIFSINLFYKKQLR